MNGQRIRLREKNIEDNWSLRLNQNIFLCSKCKKYNTINLYENHYFNSSHFKAIFGLMK